MWAQMIKTRIKPGQEATVQQLPEEMRTRFGDMESHGGPARLTVLQDQNDPGTYFTLIFFESEAKAREYEGSPTQQAIQKRMMEVWEGQPEFTDLNVVHDTAR